MRRNMIESIQDIDNMKDCTRKPLAPSMNQFFKDAYEKGYMVFEDGSILTTIIKNENFHDEARLLFAVPKDETISAWYCEEDDMYQRGLGEFDCGEGLDKIISECIRLANTCPECHKLIGAKNMVRYGFADFACKNCKGEAYKKFENQYGSNWYN